MTRRAFSGQLSEYFEQTRDCLKKPANEQLEALAILFADIVTLESHVTLIYLALVPIRIAMAIKRATTLDQTEYLDLLDHHLDVFADNLRVVAYQPSDQIPSVIETLNDVQFYLDMHYASLPLIYMSCSKIKRQLLEILNRR